MDALLSLDYVGIVPHACSLYTTLVPCSICMATFYMSGLRTLHYAARDPYAGSVDLLGKTFYLSQKSIQVHGPIPEPEIVLIAIIIGQDYIRQHETLGDHHFYRRYHEVLPEGMHLDEAIYRSGLLERLRKTSVPSSTAFEELSAYALRLASFGPDH